MKTVLHTVDTWGPGGAETVCVELAAGLDPHRFRSCATAIREGWVYDAMRAHKLDTTIVRTGRGPFDVAYLWHLTALARRQRASLIQSHLLTANLYAGIAARLLRIPSVATFHGMVDIPADDRRAHTKMRLITANASRLVFVSDALRRHFCERYAVPDKRTSVVHNGVDAAHFHPAPHQALRQELGLDPSTVLIASVGNVRHAKGYGGLLQAAALLKREVPSARFVVVGERTDPLYTALRAQQHQLQLDDTIIYLGFRADVAHILNGVDIYVNASTSEGFSLTTIQAMACGIPVVATRSGGPEEIIRDDVDGVLVPVNDAAALATELGKLAGDAARRRRFGEAGRATVLERFTLTRMIDAYESIYDKVLGQ